MGSHTGKHTHIKTSKTGIFKINTENGTIKGEGKKKGTNENGIVKQGKTDENGKLKESRITRTTTTKKK